MLLISYSSEILLFKDKILRRELSWRKKLRIVSWWFDLNFFVQQNLLSKIMLDKNLDCLKYKREENEFCEISLLPVWHLHVLCVASDFAGRLKCWTNFCSKCSNCQPSFQLLNRVHIHDARFWASIAVFRSQTKFIIPWIRRKEFFPFAFEKPKWLCRINLVFFVLSVTVSKAKCSIRHSADWRSKLKLRLWQTRHLKESFILF